ncbi:TetR/AcrR family transcriptional regulator [Cohnella fermenti]|uniref:TetR/AcrR family transcriptional regulator n=1 Tax=Cohnella fermenti TaxID=2565925 RepID=A0A4S4BI16_9BACL|nr:TetR/AcrR family transcriptional regulator [Cohnella fermenti]THF74205.1 TetR/AcrR family transcriptional regulator [Cohnella fermenti]
MNEFTNPGLNTTASTLQEARQQHSEHLRQSVVQVAASLLREYGPEAVTVRRVAERMECSTKIIYSLFNRKEGLAKELYLEGCRILGREFEATALTGIPEADLQRLAQAYWRFGQEHASFYQVMFGGAFAEFKPDEISMQGMTTAWSQVTALIASADLDENSPEWTARLIWAALHGVIHLHLAGQLGSGEEAAMLYDRTVAMIVHSLFDKRRN